MSNPVTMGLGGLPFHAHGFSYNKRKRKVDASWSAVSLAGAPDAGQWTGGKSTKVHIGGVLFPAEFGGTGGLAMIEALATRGAVVPLFTLGGAANFFGMYQIERVSEDQTFILPNGTPLRDAYEIELTLYQGQSFNPTSVISFF